MIALIREMVECESPSDNPPAVKRFVDLVSGAVAGMASVRTFSGGRFGPHLLCEFVPRKARGAPILVLGHSDTVWPLGTLKQMRFGRDKDRLWGPGVLDMKAGIAFFIFAMKALLELDSPPERRVRLLLTSDEEMGSESSRPLIERVARRSALVLVLEPGTGLDGRLKTARKGVGAYTLTVHGRAAHAGVDFSAGASAVLELARQIGRIAALTDLRRGVTVNPGVICGGARSNVVASEARAEIDIRVPRLRDAAALERRFRALRPFDRRCRIEISGGLNRPPMERSRGIVRLFRQAQETARNLGVELRESSTGGGSDGNFTAALGVPTLDGLGAVGEGAHALNESVLIDRMADRTALLAGLLLSLEP